MSVWPPSENGTMIVIGYSGHSARAGTQISMSISANIAVSIATFGACLNEILAIAHPIISNWRKSFCAPHLWEAD